MSRSCVAGFVVAFVFLSAQAQAAPQCPPSAGIGTWSVYLDWTPQVVPPASNCVGFPNYMPVEFSHAALIPTGIHKGKVLLWHYRPNPNSPGCAQALPAKDFYLFNPDKARELIRFTQLLPSDLFCSGQSWDSSAGGNLLVVGGAGGTTNPDTYRFIPERLTPVDPDSDPPVLLPFNINSPPWVQLSPMTLARFYPTVQPMSNRTLYRKNGTVFAGGSTTMVLGGHTGLVPQNCPWGAESYEFMDASPTNSAWSPSVIPEDAEIKNTQLVGLPGAERYSLHPSSGPTKPNVLMDSYPRSFQVSTHEVLVTGDVDTYLPANRPGHTWVIKPLTAPPTGAQPDWQLHTGEDADDRYYGSAVILHDQKLGGLLDRVLLFGGAYNTTPDPDLTDCEDDTATWVVSAGVQEFVPGSPSDPFVDGTWQSKANMLSPRMFLNAVVLPTGQVFLNGGTSVYPIPPTCPQPVNFPEIYDPGATRTAAGSSIALCTSPLETAVPAPQSVPRLYHHLAMLLQDGRVLVAGGEQPRENCITYPQAGYSGQVFTPPYLHLGHRPNVTGISAPSPVPFYTTAAPSFTLNVVVTPGHQVVSVALLRPAALTHHYDNDQRYIELPFTYNAGAGTVTVERLKPELGPAGHYMIFVLEAPSTSTPRGQWAPSIGKFLRFA